MSRRAKITPDQAGLPPAGRRRVPGLRRIEVAMLAGVSVEYYSRLERGDAAGVSESVLDAIAGALQLDDAERRHLLDLVRTSGATRAPRRRTPVPRVRPDRPVRPRRHHRSARRSSTTAASNHLGGNALGKALFSPFLASGRRAAQQRPVHVPRPARLGVPPRLGQSRQRHRRHPARRSRPRPLRPQPVRPHRRALHPQRRVPDPLGLPRRPHPRHRDQATPPPRGRRPRPLLRVVPERPTRARTSSSTSPNPTARPTTRSTCSPATPPPPLSTRRTSRTRHAPVAPTETPAAAGPPGLRSSYGA